MDMRVFTVVSQKAECIELVLLTVCSLSHHTLRTLSFSNHGSQSLGKPTVFSGDPSCNLLLTELNWLPLQLKIQSRKTKSLNSVGSQGMSGNHHTEAICRIA